MSENNINDCSTNASDGESIEEEIEPKLKYVRMANDLQDVLSTETASCIAVHPKFVCLGTSWGVVHLFDHQGNRIRNSELKSHTVAVNMISIDAHGECVASCSGDGNVHVSALFGNDDVVTVTAGRHVTAVALDPESCGGCRRARFISGDDKLTLHERYYTVLGMGRLKSTVLCDSEAPVGSVAWRGQFVAWSSTVGVRVYDIKGRRSLGLIRWEKPVLYDDDDGGQVYSLDDFRCNLRWADDRTLLMGWCDTVRVCIIRKRGAAPVVTVATATGALDDEPPEYQVDPIFTYRTEFFISGIAPLDTQLVLLGVPKERDKSGRCLRPQLHVVEYRDCEYTEVCTDSLSLRGYAQYSCTDYHLDVLPEENRFFVVAPKDVVIASPCDVDDRVHWLVQHSRYEQAMEVVEEQKHQNTDNASGTSTNTNTGRRHTILSVGTTYLDHLLAKNEFNRAAKLCLRLFGRDADLWHNHVYKFARVRQLRAVSAYLPHTLGPQIYEMVLYEYLKTDAKGFLHLVREWHQKSLYNTAAVVNAVLEHFLIADVDVEVDRPVIMEALAILYGHEGSYEKALSMYLKLQHVAVFDMIRDKYLYGSIHSMIVDLMQLDQNKAVELLLHDRQQVPPEVVVTKLSGRHERHLYRYLDALNKVDPRECGPYHGLMVRLYAVFAREKLLPFLKRSDQYPIQEALDACQKQHFYPETVYLLGRIGDTKEALALITSRLGDVKHAFEFCQEHDDAELWSDLVEHSADRPDFVTYLLPRVAGHIDPRDLVNRIKPGVQVIGLRDSLVRMLRQCNLQASIQEGCQKILVADYFALHERLVRAKQRGVKVGDELHCGACHRKLIVAGTDSARVGDVVAYNCKHVFHQVCLPVPLKRVCAICSPSELTKSTLE